MSEQPEGSPDVEQIYIREAAIQLNRRMSTLRKWEYLKVLPDNLKSQRGIRGWRYWTPEQIEGIRDWIRETDRRSGKGLPHYNPTEAELDKAIQMMRKPRRKYPEPEPKKSDKKEENGSS